MKKKNSHFLTKSDIRKQYHINERSLQSFLPKPDKYGFANGQRFPLWRRQTVEETFSKPRVKALIEAQRQEKIQREQAALRYEQRARAIKNHLLQYDISSMIEAAKEMQRRFIIHCGPTNSGKTYQALQALKQAESGCYLGPLRLLALEMFDNINMDGAPCSLLTGEESIEIPFANITASTIEMCDFYQHYQIAVIDEAQLITDKSRGGHWLNAILRIQAEEVHICVAPEGLHLVETLVAQTESPYEIIQHERLTHLRYKGGMPTTGYKYAQPGDAFIAFSRKAVLAIAAELESHGIHASVIYGALPPQSRREEVRKFAKGENSVVVATDAIGMGVSLPIRRIIFCQTSKYDGIEFRPLTPTEIKQIAGRAGRYGKYPEGQVLSMDSNRLIRESLKADIEPFASVTIPFPKEALDGQFSLSELLEAWRELPPVEGFYYEDMSEARVLYSNLSARMGDKLSQFPEDEVLRYITCPTDVKNQKIVDYWTLLAISLLKGYEILPEPGLSTETLSDCEDAYKLLDVQHQMLNRAGIRADVSEQKREVEQRINELLNADKSLLRRTCSRCGRALPPAARFNICDACFILEREEKRRMGRGRA